MNDDQIARDMMALRPMLIRFGYKLCADADRSEDLASEAITRAWKHRARFEPGTSLSAWLFIILRNQFLTEQRRKRWSGGYLADMPALVASLGHRASQEDYIILKDVEKAFTLMTRDKVEALMAVVLNGTYEEAAEASNCAVGTIKSRVMRGRTALNELLA